jgi:hypothetical protein
MSSFDMKATLPATVFHSAPSMQKRRAPYALRRNARAWINWRRN